MTFAKWIDLVIEEKGTSQINPDRIIEVQGDSGLNMIPVASLIEAMKAAPSHEQKSIRSQVVHLDFYNQPIMPFFEHLARAIAI